jgi:hypothetical protein
MTFLWEYHGCMSSNHGSTESRALWGAPFPPNYPVFYGALVSNDPSPMNTPDLIRDFEPHTQDESTSSIDSGYGIVSQVRSDDAGALSTNLGDEILPTREVEEGIRETPSPSRRGAPYWGQTRLSG